MSSTQKVKKLKREIAYTATWATNVLTVTTAATHYLKSTDVVDFLFADSPQEYVGAVVTVTGANTFTIPLTNYNLVQTVGRISIPYFSAGQTGDQAVFTLGKTTGASSIIQLTAHGAAGAVVVVNVSNDGAGWVPIATVTLASADLATDFVSVAPNWVQGKLSITSIGASTAVVATVTS